MTISVRYTSIDGFRQTRRFRNLTAARAFAVNWVGVSPEVGRTYAVSSDGIGKVTVSGCTLAELFAGEIGSAPAFEVQGGSVYEGDYCQPTTINFATVRAFADLDDAILYVDGMWDQGWDDARIVGTNEAAKAEVAAYYARLRARAAEFNIEMPF